MKPLVSIIIPYLNAGRFIGGAINSIRRQNYTPLEIIVIDDGSSDDIAQRVSEWGDDIVFLQQDNRGPASARNLGLKHARGEFITFLDADDIWPDNRLPPQVERLCRNPELGIVTGHIRYEWLGVPEENIRFTDNKNRALVHVHLGAATMRRDVFNRVGLLNDRLIFNEDLDWFLRVHEQEIPMLVTDDVTLVYQRHANNMTRNKRVQDTNLLAVLKASLDRRRQSHKGQVPEFRSLFGLR